MEESMKHLLKPLFMVAALTLTIGFGNVQSAFADEVTVTGTASGMLSGSTTGLTFSGSSFSGTTSNGFLAFGGNASPGSNVDNFGSFTLGTSPTSLSGTFTLNLTFTAPTGIVGGQGTTFNAVVTGNVTNSTTGGAQVTFADPVRVFSFTNGSTTGSFTLNLNNVAINPGQSASVTGFITGAQVTGNPIPEPATMLLLGTGLAGVAGAVRRRRKGAQAAN
jgi:hypothetical protein